MSYMWKSSPIIYIIHIRYCLAGSYVHEHISLICLVWSVSAIQTNNFIMVIKKQQKIIYKRLYFSHLYMIDHNDKDRPISAHNYMCYTCMSCIPILYVINFETVEYVHMNMCLWMAFYAHFLTCGGCPLSSNTNSNNPFQSCKSPCLTCIWFSCVVTSICLFLASICTFHLLKYQLKLYGFIKVVMYNVNICRS